MTAAATGANCCPSSKPKVQNPTPVQKNCLDKLFPLSIVERVFRIALSILAMAIAPVLFAATFTFGAVWAAIDPTLTKKTCEQAGSYICSQGFIEQLSGLNIPAPLGVLADFVVKYVHIAHHPGVFVPLTGLGVGLWVGGMVRESVAGSKS